MGGRWLGEGGGDIRATEILGRRNSHINEGRGCEERDLFHILASRPLCSDAIFPFPVGVFALWKEGEREVRRNVQVCGVLSQGVIWR